MALRKLKTTLVASGGTDQVQRLSITAGSGGDTFKLTFNGHQSSVAVTLDADYSNNTAADVQACVNSISDFSTPSNRPTVTKVSGGVFDITFSGGVYRSRINGAVTMTSKTGAADGSIVVHTQGVACSISPTLQTRGFRPLRMIAYKLTPGASVLEPSITLTKTLDGVGSIGTFNTTGSVVDLDPPVVADSVQANFTNAQTGDTATVVLWYESAGDTRF